MPDLNARSTSEEQLLHRQLQGLNAQLASLEARRYRFLRLARSQANSSTLGEVVVELERVNREHDGVRARLSEIDLERLAWRRPLQAKREGR